MSDHTAPGADELAVRARLAAALGHGAPPQDTADTDTTEPAGTKARRRWWRRVHGHQHPKPDEAADTTGPDSTDMSKDRRTFRTRQRTPGTPTPDHDIPASDPTHVADLIVQAHWELLVNDNETFVYLIGPVDGSPVNYMKIGYAKNPWVRLIDLQSGNHLELDIHAVAPGGPETERRMHETLASMRVRGEWFDLGDRPLRVFWNAYRELPVRRFEQGVRQGPPTFGTKKLVERLWAEGLRNQDDIFNAVADQTNGTVSPETVSRYLRNLRKEAS